MWESNPSHEKENPASASHGKESCIPSPKNGLRKSYNLCMSNKELSEMIKGDVRSLRQKKKIALIGSSVLTPPKKIIQNMNDSNSFDVVKCLIDNSLISGNCKGHKNKKKSPISENAPPTSGKISEPEAKEKTSDDNDLVGQIIHNMDQMKPDVIKNLISAASQDEDNADSGGTNAAETKDLCFKASHKYVYRNFKISNNIILEKSKKADEPNWSKFEVASKPAAKDVHTLGQKRYVINNSNKHYCLMCKSRLVFNTKESFCSKCKRSSEDFPLLRRAQQQMGFLNCRSISAPKQRAHLAAMKVLNKSASVSCTRSENRRFQGDSREVKHSRCRQDSQQRSYRKENIEYDRCDIVSPHQTNMNDLTTSRFGRVNHVDAKESLSHNVKHKVNDNIFKHGNANQRQYKKNIASKKLELKQPICSKEERDIQSKLCKPKKSTISKGELSQMHKIATQKCKKNFKKLVSDSEDSEISECFATEKNNKCKDVSVSDHESESSRGSLIKPLRGKKRMKKLSQKSDVNKHFKKKIKVRKLSVSEDDSSDNSLDKLFNTKHSRVTRKVSKQIDRSGVSTSCSSDESLKVMPKLFIQGEQNCGNDRVESMQCNDVENLSSSDETLSKHSTSPKWCDEICNSPLTDQTNHDSSSESDNQGSGDGSVDGENSAGSCFSIGDLADDSSKSKQVLENGGVDHENGNQDSQNPQSTSTKKTEFSDRVASTATSDTSCFISDCLTGHSSKCDHFVSGVKLTKLEVPDEEKLNSCDNSKNQEINGMADLTSAADSKSTSVEKSHPVSLNKELDNSDSVCDDNIIDISQSPYSSPVVSPVSSCPDPSSWKCDGQVISATVDDIVSSYPDGNHVVHKSTSEHLVSDEKASELKDLEEKSSSCDKINEENDIMVKCPVFDSAIADKSQLATKNQQWDSVDNMNDDHMIDLSSSPVSSPVKSPVSLGPGYTSTKSSRRVILTNNDEVVPLFSGDDIHIKVEEGTEIEMPDSVQSDSNVNNGALEEFQKDFFYEKLEKGIYMMALPHIYEDTDNYKSSVPRTSEKSKNTDEEYELKSKPGIGGITVMYQDDETPVNEHHKPSFSEATAKVVEQPKSSTFNWPSQKRPGSSMSESSTATLPRESNFDVICLSDDSCIALSGDDDDDENGIQFDEVAPTTAECSVPSEKPEQSDDTEKDPAVFHEVSKENVCNELSSNCDGPGFQIIDAFSISHWDAEESSVLVESENLYVKEDLGVLNDAPDVIKEETEVLSIEETHALTPSSIQTQAKILDEQLNVQSDGPVHISDISTHAANKSDLATKEKRKLNDIFRDIDNKVKDNQCFFDAVTELDSVASANIVDVGISQDNYLSNIKKVKCNIFKELQQLINNENQVSVEKLQSKLNMLRAVELLCENGSPEALKNTEVPNNEIVASLDFPSSSRSESDIYSVPPTTSPQNAQFSAYDRTSAEVLDCNIKQVCDSGIFIPSKSQDRSPGSGNASPPCEVLYSEINNTNISESFISQRCEPELEDASYNYGSFVNPLAKNQCAPRVATSHLKGDVLHQQPAKVLRNKTFISPAAAFVSLPQTSKFSKPMAGTFEGFSAQQTPFYGDITSQNNESEESVLFCVRCQKFAIAMCRRCTKVAYCSEACALKYWSEVHYKQCA